jgi:hypothetical protein
LKKGNRGTSKDTCTIEEEKDVQTVESSIDNIKEQVSHTNRPKRKYDESYLQYGFTCTGESDAPVAVCVLCQTKLANSSLYPAKLCRHLERCMLITKKKILFFFFKDNVNQ